MTELDPAAATPGTRRRTITIASLTLGALAAGGVIAAVAATSADASGPSGSGSSSSSSAPSSTATQCAAGTDFDGLVTSADSSSVTVRDLLGSSRTYAISSSTSIHEGPSTKVSASSLAKGEHVHVRGTQSGSTYKATDIDVRHAAIDGSITSLGTNSITVTDRDGFTRSIVTDGSTTYSSAGKTVSRSSLSSGTAIHAEGSVDSDGTSLDADSVNKLVAGSGPAGGPALPKADSRPAAPAKGAAPKAGSAPVAPCGPAGGPGAGGPGGRGPAGGPPANGSTPSGAPTGKPSGAPTGKPSGAPSGAPTSRPSGAPSAPSAPASPSGSAS